MIPAGDYLPEWDELVARHGDGLLRFNAGADMVAQRCGGKLVYIATPYSREVVSQLGEWRESRSTLLAEESAWASIQLMKRGATGVAPVAQSHMMLQVGRKLMQHLGLLVDPLDAMAWGKWCSPILAACGCVWVPAFQGWWRSSGILIEARTALATQRQVFVEAERLPS